MNNLLKHCRYYKGEDDCPESISNAGDCSLWFYERVWVMQESHRDEKDFDTLEYIRYGLKDFNTDDGTPITLKALLFNRYCHWIGGWGMENDVKGFKEWYIDYYLKSTMQK